MSEISPVSQTPQPNILNYLGTHRIAAVFQRRATWVLIDQGIVSAGNFLTGALLARNLPQSDFGLFAILLETMLYLNSLQAALVIYPLTIRGATGERGGLGRLATASIFITLALLPILGTAIAAAAGIHHGVAVTSAAIGALVLWQLQETLRRALISELRFSETLWGDAISYLGQAVCVGLLAYLGQLTLARTLMLMALTSGLAIGVQSLQIGLQKIRPWEFKLVVRDFWRLGRWMALTNAGGAITSLGYWYTLRGFKGEEACAVFGAIAQLFKLANPVISSMSGLIVPAVARASAADGLKSAKRIALRYIAFGAALLSGYFLILIAIPVHLLSWLYKPTSPYVSQAPLLRLFVANYCVVYISAVVGSWLAGLGRSRYNFNAQVVNIVLTVLVGMPLTAKYGVSGLVWGGLLSSFASICVCLYYIHHVNKHPVMPLEPQQ